MIPIVPKYLIPQKLSKAFKTIDSIGLLIHFIFDELYSLDEAAFSNRNHHIYRVEVFPAVKASGQVGLMLDGRMEVFAYRASEP